MKQNIHMSMWHAHLLAPHTVCSQEYLLMCFLCMNLCFIAFAWSATGGSFIFPKWNFTVLTLCLHQVCPRWACQTRVQCCICVNMNIQYGESSSVPCAAVFLSLAHILLNAGWRFHWRSGMTLWYLMPQVTNNVICSNSKHVMWILMSWCDFTYSIFQMLSNDVEGFQLSSITVQ